MIRTTFLSFFMWSVTAFACISAQQVYQSHHFGGPGTIYLYNRLFGFNQDTALTKAGADITWDLTSETALNTHASRVVTPDAAFDIFTFLTICGLGGNSTAECATIWANTQQAWLLQDSITLFQFVLENLQRFQKKTPDYLLENFIGFRVDLGELVTPAVIVYQNPDTILHFPVIYGDEFTSSTSWFLDLSPSGQNIKYESHQQRDTRIDSWGTLVTPYQTFENVVRMRSVIERQDSITTDSFSMALNLTQVEYMWLDTNYKLPIMSANGIIMDTIEILNTIEYIYDSVCETPTWTLSIDGTEFYLDESGTVTIDFTINDSNADEYTWDFGNGEFETTTGSASFVFDEPGFYSVGVTGCMTNCLPLNSCVSAIVDFEIFDTTTAIQVIPAELAGIRLRPNPIQDQIHLFIPDHVGQSLYSIIDMHGRYVLRGEVMPGSTVIDAADLADGIYAIRIEPIDLHAKQIYSIRFVVQK